MKNYPYEIVDKIISEAYPEEARTGGVIDFIDFGELHALFAKIYEEVLKNEPKD